MPAKLRVPVHKGNPAEKILIVAPTLGYMREWCIEHGINPNARNVKYVFRERDLCGYNGVWLIHLGLPDLPRAEYMSMANRIHMMRTLFNCKNPEEWVDGTTADGS